MTPKVIKAPSGARLGKHPVYAAHTSAKRQWDKLCHSHSGSMVKCYEELANNSCPPWATPRHHQLKGKKHIQGNGPFWEYEVGGGERVRYKKGPNGEAVVVWAGTAPSLPGGWAPGRVEQVLVRKAEDVLCEGLALYIAAHGMRACGRGPYPL